MFPQTLLQAAQNTQVLIEVRSGQTYNGIMVNKDNYMNMNLKDVTIGSKNGTEFHTVPTCFIRGTQIKYVQVSNETAQTSIDGFNAAAVAARASYVESKERDRENQFKLTGNKERDRNYHHKESNHKGNYNNNNNNNNNNRNNNTNNNNNNRNYNKNNTNNNRQPRQSQAPAAPPQ